MHSQNNQIIVYTDNPESYKSTLLNSLTDINYCSCPEQLCDEMLEKEYSGLVLDIHKIMKTPCCIRNRILSFSDNMPTMRALEKTNKPIFLDSHEDFLCNCQSNCCAGHEDSCPINVNIPVEISLDNDPAMAKGIHGTIHHIFDHGCSFHTKANLSEHNFLYLKIYELKNQLPIYVGICSRQNSSDFSCGYKVKFLCIKNDQKQEMNEKFILS